MISILLYDRARQEMEWIADDLHRLIARHSMEESRIRSCYTREGFSRQLEETDLGDLALLDVSGKDGVELAKGIRKKYPEARILLIADSSMPPNLYIRPAIMASALLLRPFSMAELRETLEEFVLSFLDGFREHTEQVFTFETRDGITKIPYRQIYYYESSLKKVLIRLKSEEYSYYHTLDQLMEVLPEDFVRCHRSYIVNKNKVLHYDASAGSLFLQDDVVVPVSRSYRNAMRELVK